jgi:hypothetical protein
MVCFLDGMELKSLPAIIAERLYEIKNNYIGVHAKVVR